MKTLLIALALALTTQAEAKTLRLETLGATLSTRFSAGIEKYFTAAKTSERASAQLANGSITLKIYDSTACSPNVENCQDLMTVAYEVQLPIYHAEKFECGKDQNGKNIYGVLYQAETPKTDGEVYESILLMDNTGCPQSDRGVGYLTYYINSARGPAKIQFFVDAIYR